MSEPSIYKSTPYPHQVRELEDSRERKYWGLFWEMGLGKSKTTIDTIAHLYRTGQIKGAAIIAPKGVYRNWQDEEIPAHMPDDIPYHVVRWTSYQTKANKLLLDQMWRVKDKLKILLMNIEAIRTVKGGHYLETFLKYEKPNILIIDESHTIKTPSSKQGKTAVVLAKHASYRRILTGTPVSQGPLDLYNQLRFLDPYTLGYSSFFAFRNRFAVMQTRRLGPRTFNEIVGYKNLDELNKILNKMGSRLKKEDCLDLPEKIYLQRAVTLTNDQMNMYNSIRKDAVLMLTNAKNQGILTAPLALTVLEKLHQIVCGHVKDDDGNVFPIENNRIDALLETIEEMEGQVVIWAGYVHNIKEIELALGKKYGSDQVVTYYGGTSDELRALAKARFKAKEVRFFVGNPSVGGYGLTLVTAANVIYYSNNYKLIDRIQSEDRVHRIGQTRPVTYVDLFVPSTVDEKIMRALRSKEDLAAKIVDNYQTLIGGEPGDWTIDQMDVG